MEMIGSSEESVEHKEEVFDLESSKSWITRRALELQLPLMEKKAKSEFPIRFKAKVADYFTAKSKIPTWKNSVSEKLMYTMLQKAMRNSVQISDVAEEQLPSRIIIGGVDTGKEVEAEVAGGVPTGDEAEWGPADDDEDVEELRYRIAQLTAGSSIQMDDDDDVEDLEKVMRRIEEKDEAPHMDTYSDLINFLQNQMKKLLQTSYFSTEGKAIVSVWSDCEKIQRGIKKLLSASAQIDEICRLIPEMKEVLRLISCINSSEYNSAAAEEEKQFAAYRHMWEVFNGKKFDEFTSLSSMIFTNCAPGRMPWYAVVKPTLQIISIKIIGLTGLEWPLKIYGIIAARDAVDNRRNPIFLCSRNGGQLVTQQDPFLCLTGPSRAILCEETVSFEIQLKLKGRIEFEDKVLISTKLSYNRDSADSFSILNIGNHFCKMELCYQKLEKSVQATIVGVRVVSQGLSLRRGA